MFVQTRLMLEDNRSGSIDLAGLPFPPIYSSTLLVARNRSTVNIIVSLCVFSNLYRESIRTCSELFHNSGSNSGYREGVTSFSMLLVSSIETGQFSRLIKRELIRGKKKKIIIIEQTISRSNEESRTSP